MLGALGYPVLELIWRGRTHSTMALAGGIACLLMGRCAQVKGSLAKKALLSGLSVTGVEYLFGMIFNRRHRIWDYRREPGNIAGQICPRYFALWTLLSLSVLNLPLFRSCEK